MVSAVYWNSRLYALFECQIRVRCIREVCFKVVLRERIELYKVVDTNTQYYESGDTV
jgi:hypothetical protein